MENVAFGSAVVRLERAVLDHLRANGDSSLGMAGAIGSQVKMQVDELWLLGNVRDMELDRSRPDAIMVNIDFLGEGDRGPDGALVAFHRGVTRYPRSGDRVFAVGDSDLAQVFATDARPHIEIGTVYPTKSVRAALFIDQMLSGHFALVGSSGTGKSTTTALILHKIIDKAPEGHIVVIDPHGEYDSAFRTRGVIYNVDNLKMPYWLLNFEEHCEVFLTSEGVEREIDKDILAKCLMLARSKNDVAHSFVNLTVDSPVPYLLADLIGSIDAQMGRLSQAADMARYARIKNKIEEMVSDTRYTFMFDRSLVADSMQSFLADILRLPANGRPISIIDLSGVPSDIVSVVVAVLSRIVLDFAIWSRRQARRPILLVCEEAHRYVPAERIETGAAVRKILERIAKEGRKYGVSLGLVTQRPSDVAEGALSQCGTIISMRLNNERDQAWIRNAMPEGARGFLDSIPALRNRECIICGEGVTIPVRVRFDTLDPELRPESADPVFSKLWTDVGGEADLLQQTISVWRSQSLDAAPNSLLLR